MSLPQQEINLFWHRNSPLSIHHPSLFVYEGNTFMCVEQFALYQQAVLFGEQSVADKILDLASNLPHIKPNQFVHSDDTFLALFMQQFKSGELSRKDIKESEYYSREWKRVLDLLEKWKTYLTYHNDDIRRSNELMLYYRNSWKQHQKEIYTIGNQEKYQQNSDLQEVLLMTVGTILAYAVKEDLVLGIGYNIKEDQAKNREQWTGKNVLGDILMNIRDNLTLNPSTTIKIK